MRKLDGLVEKNKASLGLRFVNNLIDGLIINFGPSLVMIIIGFVLGIIGYEQIIDQISLFQEEHYILNLVLGLFLYVLYFYFFEFYSDGRTIGKYVTGTKVLSIDGTKPTSSELWTRSFSRLVPFDGLSFFGNNGWHDSWSDTRVINISEYEKAKILDTDLENLGKQEN